MKSRALVPVVAEVMGYQGPCRHEHTLSVWRISPELESRVCVDCWTYFPVTICRLADGTLLGPGVSMEVAEMHAEPREYPFTLGRAASDT